MSAMKSDASLIQEALSGDMNAFNPLVERYQQSVFTLACSIVRDLDAAEDIAQETFITAYGKLSELKDPKRFAAWLRKIAVNTARMWQRKHSTKKKTEGVDPSISPDAGKGGLKNIISDALASLPETKRQLAVLCYMDGYSRKDVARFLGVPENTLRKRLFDTKRLLQRKIVKEAEKNLEEHLLPKDFAKRCMCACKQSLEAEANALKETMAMRIKKDNPKKSCGCGCLPKGKAKAKKPSRKKSRS